MTPTDLSRLFVLLFQALGCIGALAGNWTLVAIAALSILALTASSVLRSEGIAAKRA